MPAVGGILDQEAGLLDKMALCEDAFYTVYEYVNLPPGRAAAWGKANPKKRQFVVDLMYGK